MTTNDQCRCPARPRLSVHAWPCPQSEYEQLHFARHGAYSVTWSDDGERFDLIHFDAPEDPIPDSAEDSLLDGPMSLASVVRFTPNSANESWNLVSAMEAACTLSARHARAAEIRRAADLVHAEIKELRRSGDLTQAGENQLQKIITEHFDRRAHQFVPYLLED